MLTVREIVNLFRAYYPSPLPAARAIALAGLDARADARAGTLSGGERQRLYFALAVCGDPEALFLDEPTVGMDVETRRGVLESIRALSATGKTIVLTTHYLEEADQLAHRIVVIDRGVVIADATPREIKSRIPSKRINFRPETAVGDTTFRGLPVQNLEIADHRVHLLSNEPEVVLQALFERGVVVRDLEVTGADLEEAFLSLTRRA
jgi:ABC-2 type transport system ATP-binding protein